MTTTTTTTTTTTRQTPDLDAVERDANERIAELGAQRQRLALDAIGDAKICAELEAVESELAGAQAELGRVELARAERERREQQAAADAEDARRGQALDEARRLQGERKAAGHKIDQSAAKLLSAITAYVAVCSDQQRAFTEAGRDQAASAARPKPFVVSAGLIHAKRQVGLPDAFLELPGITAEYVGPVSDRDPNLIDAYVGKE